MRSNLIAPRTAAALAGLALASSAAFPPAARGDPFINEFLFNPPGTDAPNEYVELRGLPGATLVPGTYLVGVEGDGGAAETAGDVQNVFDLSGRSFGSNGFLVLLQRDNLYSPNPAATLLANAGSGPGFGSGAGSSTVGHSGDGSATDVENASATYLLIQSAAAPGLADDIDTNNDGTPDGVFAGWTVLDSVGVLDGTAAAGDFAYGRVNFRNTDGNGAAVVGTVVDGDFTANYVGRIGNSVGSTASDWVGADVSGTAPDFRLGDTDISDPNLAGAPLNHIGGPNPVPEPLAALPAALVGLLWIARRRRA